MINNPISNESALTPNAAVIDQPNRFARLSVAPEVPHDREDHRPFDQRPHFGHDRLSWPAEVECQPPEHYFQGRALYGALATYHAYLEFPVLWPC